MEKWYQNCQVCNNGLVGRFEELKKEGHAERKAARLLEKEALKEYPEMEQEFSADRLRKRYQYHMKGGDKKEVGENLPPADDRPKCITCDDKPVIVSKKTGQPMKHGLCYGCRKNANGKKNDQLPKKVSKKVQKEFDKKSADPKAHKYWSNVASKMDDLFKEPVIGKVGVDVLRKVINAQGLMNQHVALMEDESTP